MSRLDFIFGIHCHQPVGNFDYVFEAAYQDAYLPFIETLERYPEVKVTLHYTGPLLEYFEAEQPEFLDRLAALVAAGQVEILSGGFYEPILSVIPETDRQGQIALLSEYLETRFDQPPQGMWLAERVWEPQLPSTLTRARIRYLPIDDFHFKRAGLEDEELFGHYLTEDLNRTVSVFPINEKLRYMIPFRLVEKVIEFLKQIQKHGATLVTMIDDGEKFGVWPGTRKWVYEEGWLDLFFKTLTENRDWLHTCTLGEGYREHAALGRVYLPTTAYFELTEWAMPATTGRELEDLQKQLDDQLETYRPFLAGGFWRNFLAKYPESNHMHKRMLRTSRRLAELQVQGYSVAELAEAHRALYRAQSNDPYWHGVFGGLYLSHLRDATYRHLIEADRALDRLTRQEEHWVEAKAEDCDGDLNDEILVDTDQLFAMFKPTDGGVLVELDDKIQGFNHLNTLTRREEIYHREIIERDQSTVSAAESEGEGEGGSEAASIHEIAKEINASLVEALIYDRYRRSSVIDHFLPVDTDLEALMKNDYRELGDFTIAPYRHRIISDADADATSIELTRDGGVSGSSITLKKRARFYPRMRGFDLDWELVNRSEATLEVKYGVEFNFSMLAGDALDRFYLIDGAKPDNGRFASVGASEGVEEVRLVNDWDRFAIVLCLNRTGGLWRFPIETVSSSEAGFERVYQSSCLIFHWDIHLEPGARWEMGIRYEIVALDPGEVNQTG
ncbi:MAG: alpha-amylase/4-alpha-glucanotransferase domain-containing protein [Candidatus Bipolaricaulia bacterium]